MKTTMKAAILLLATCMTGTSQVALADHTAACDALIADPAVGVIGAINSAAYSGKMTPDGEFKDQKNMVLKAEAAIFKLGVHKLEDAVDKLLDISEKANSLEDARKPKLDGAGAIDSAIENAIACINNL
jgi:hypothetical protein